MNRRGCKQHIERGFTLTELLVALVLASGILVGMAELSRQMVRSIGQIRSDIEQTQSLRRLNLIGELVSRADPELEQSQYLLGETSLLEQRVEDGAIEVRYFRDGQVIAEWSISQASMASWNSWRTVEFDCSYDLIADRCRS